MADIFISYKKEDGDRVARLVDGIRAERLQLWWDRDIAPGALWDDTIRSQMEGAHCIVAVWSERSVAAQWVKEEANYGKSRGNLVPVRIDPVEPPLGFGLIQAADLSRWTGDLQDANWRTFVDNLRKVVRGERLASLAAPEFSRRRRRAAAFIVGLAAVAVTALGVGIYSVMAPNTLAPVGTAEQTAWTDALKAKARAPYEAYLASFPNGRFVAEARAALSTCRKVAEPRSEPFERKMDVHGNTSADAFGDRESAILSARDHGRELAEKICGQIAADEKVADMATRVETAMQPMCSPLGPKATTCSQSLWVTCKGIKRTDIEREVCG